MQPFNLEVKARGSYGHSHRWAVLAHQSRCTVDRIGEIVLDASEDTLHGDATLAARLGWHVLPSYAVPQAPSVLDYALEVVMLGTSLAE
jgi:hypothetical protein